MDESTLTTGKVTLKVADVTEAVAMTLWLRAGGSDRTLAMGHWRRALQHVWRLGPTSAGPSVTALFL